MSRAKTEPNCFGFACEEEKLKHHLSVGFHASSVTEKRRRRERRRRIGGGGSLVVKDRFRSFLSRDGEHEGETEMKKKK